MVPAAMAGTQGGRADWQRQAVDWLRGRVVVVEAECQAVRVEGDRLVGEVEQQRVDTQGLKARVRELVARVNFTECDQSEPPPVSCDSRCSSAG